ncbi:hypothetical protein M501DRAFT_584431 [Patellaria atrata CBS 101060]|uniref:GST C-terminal domain-containing protein n=1 Tax=Patellaria atrata CBS 101060 TaxID=1346257 RepID=A0A9P4SH47_9PEZI|nr:hypothetical protein M501DRAFT_584431 [Patellaria atrata CBS 101060]
MAEENPKKDLFNNADSDGRFNRKPSTFRSWVVPSSSLNSDSASNTNGTSPIQSFPAAKGRYVLYIHLVCPWAHRTLITHRLKGLQDVIRVIELDDMDREFGWCWNGKGKHGWTEDPIYGGTKYLRGLYDRAVQNSGERKFEGRVTVPVLWDLEEGTIVNNESGEIIRMLYSAFDEFLPEGQREVSKGGKGLLPDHLKERINSMNEWVYHEINNGVYKCGFAAAQEAYDENIYKLFDALDRVEAWLGQQGKGPYLFGEDITEADIRLFPTLIRFDVAYFTIFKCNLKMIRYEYPRIHQWLRNLYWDERGKTKGAFRETVAFDAYKYGYSQATKQKVVPAGPRPNILPL